LYEARPINSIDKKTSVDVSDEDIHWNHKNDYAEFLSLDIFLSLQERQWIGKHDELMFVVVHQISELWIKLLIDELTYLRDTYLRNDDLAHCAPTLERIRSIQQQLINCWEVAVTLEPVKYLEFRETDGFKGSSGFQSYQYRMLEFILGNKNEILIKSQENKPKIQEQLIDVLNKPSLYDEVLALLSRWGKDVPKEILDRDKSGPYEHSNEVESVWYEIYKRYRENWDLYRLGETLVDIEYHFQKWRFHHLKTVERLIGTRRGTGGSSGVGYLVKALDITFFPELLTVRNRLGEDFD